METPLADEAPAPAGGANAEQSADQGEATEDSSNPIDNKPPAVSFAKAMVAHHVETFNFMQFGTRHAKTSAWLFDTIFALPLSEGLRVLLPMCNRDAI